MLEEARKREKVANAFLAATMAASAAQSPKDFVRTGHIEAPGTALMQMWAKKRGEAERNLDHGRVIPRNVKKKTFKEFVEESYLTEQSREDAEKKRLAKPNPDEWRVRNVGGGKWTTKRKESISGQGTRRRQRLKGMSYKEILAFAKRNLKSKPAELAKVAQGIEKAAKTAQTREARSKTKTTGTKHVVDHNQPQQDKRRPENRERFERVAPGDVSSNRRVVSEPENLRKGSKPPKKGEPGYGDTRSGAVRKVVKKAEESNK
jgi:hypothetical protein